MAEKYDAGSSVQSKLAPPTENQPGGAAKGTATQKFKEKVQFAKAEQYGSRAVGGHAPKDAKLYGKIQSSDYLVPDTKQEEAYQRSFTPTMRNRRRLYIWFMYGVLGIVVCLVILFVLYCCKMIEKTRVKWTKKQLDQIQEHCEASNTDTICILNAGNDTCTQVGGDGACEYIADHDSNLVMAWVIWTGTSMVLCWVAAFLVLWQPASASSGIPALIAYLNGVIPLGGKSPLTGKMTGFQSFPTLVAKTIGMILSIPSGLCLGPEGPIIHISALLAHHATNFFQNLTHMILPPKYQFTCRPGEARDFLATGAACGICVAFRAPLAGCLFVVEEAASFFTTEHLEYTFFATIITYMTARVLANPEDGFTKFKQPTGYFCTIFDTFDVVLFVVIATLGGMTGALFNQIVEHLNHLRAHHINPKAWKRLLEITILVLVTGSVNVFLPNAYKCEHPTRATLMEDSMGCLSEEDQTQISYGVVSHRAMSMLVANETDAQKHAWAQLQAHRVERERWDPDLDGLGADTGTTDHEWRDVVWLDNSDEHKHIHLHYQHSYTCNQTDYNAMSMLWLNGGVKGVKVLMQRGFPHMLSWEVLLVFFCVYFVLASYTSGTSVPAGLIVPMLLLGGSYGRAIGLLGIEAKRSMCEEMGDMGGDVTDSYYWSTVYRWIARDCQLPDPGMYAVVGMAAFLGGSGRITMMLATVVIELTDDASLIGPVGVASIISMVVGNLFNHGLYHGLIPVQNLPFLNTEPSDVMWLVSVVDVMNRKVIAISKSVKPQFIHELIAKCESGEITHNAFPIVDDADSRRVLRGIISLDNLKLAGSGAQVGQVDATSKAHGGFSLGNLIGKTNLLDYADRSPITVFPHMKVARAFEIFRKLGMRHLCVTSNTGNLVGIITRKDLMTFRLSDNIRLHKAEAMLRGWAGRWRAAQAILAEAEAKGEKPGVNPYSLKAPASETVLPGTPGA